MSRKEPFGRRPRGYGQQQPEQPEQPGQPPRSGQPPRPQQSGQPGQPPRPQQPQSAQPQQPEPQQPQQQPKEAQPSRRTFLMGASAAAAALASTTLLSGCIPSFLRDIGNKTDERGRPNINTGDGRRGGALYVASHWPYSFDPFYLQEIAGIQIAFCIFDPLVKYDYRTKTLVPAAAESWTATEEGSVFTFKLVEGARFHDGTPVTAQDFKYSWERLFKPGPSTPISPNAAYIAMIEGSADLAAGEAKEISGIKAIDELTLEVTLSFPFHEFVYLLAYPAFAPVPSTGAADDFHSFSGLPIGNGAFKIQEAWYWESDALRLVRFDDYKGEVPLLGAIEFCFYESDIGWGDSLDEDDDDVWTVADRRGVALPRAASPRSIARPPAPRPAASSPTAPHQAVLRPAVLRPAAADDNTVILTYEQKTYESFAFDELDIASVPIDQLEDACLRYGESLDGYSATPGNQVLTGQALHTQFLQLNFEREPLTDPLVRRALSYAINREAICEKLYLDSATPATGIIPPGIEGYRANAWPATTYSVQKAQEALRESGHPDGEGLAPVTLIVSDTEEENTLFKMIEEDLKAVGFRVRISRISGSTQYWDNLWRSAALATAGWIADFPIMESFLTPLFASFGTYNQFSYNNTEVDVGIMMARAIEDNTQRIQAFHDVEDIIAADVPVIPLFFMSHSLICSDRTNDLYIGPDGLIDLTKAWVTF